MISLNSDCKKSRNCTKTSSYIGPKIGILPIYSSLVQAVHCNFCHVPAKSKVLYVLGLRAPPVEVPPTPLPLNMRSSSCVKLNKETMEASHSWWHETINTLAAVLLVYSRFLPTPFPLLPMKQYEQIRRVDPIASSPRTKGGARHWPGATTSWCAAPGHCQPIGPYPPPSSVRVHQLSHLRPIKL